MKKSKLNRKIDFIGERRYVSNSSNPSYAKICECCGDKQAYNIVQFKNGDVEYICSKCIEEIKKHNEEKEINNA